MDNRQKIVSGIIAALLLAVVLWVGFSGFENKLPGVQDAASPGATEMPTSRTRQAAPLDAIVPSTNASNMPDNVAVPQSVAPVISGASASYRSFDIKVEDNQFVPNTIIVKPYDSLTINLTAVDKNYDFVQPDLGFRSPYSLPMGKTKTIAFQASAPGKFLFYCVSCGGPDRGPTGYIEVVAK